MEITPSRIVQLAASIQDNTLKLSQYLTSKNLPPLSFEDEFPDLPADMQACRNAILMATDEMTDLMHGPRQIAEMFPPVHTSMISSQAICRFGIARALGRDEKVSFAELAERCNLAVDDLTMIVRHAISRHIFKEPVRGFVAHNAASRILHEDELIDDMISTGADVMWPAASRCVDAIEKWKDSQEPNHAGFSIAHETDLSFFEDLRSNDKRRKAFDNTMTYMATRKGFGAGIDHLLASFEWDGLTIVDVGGGQGSIGAEILRHSKSATTRVIIQDLPSVISAATPTPSDLAGRLTFMPHSFFEPQTVSADVYLLRRVLHDWSNQKVISILRNLIPSLKENAYIVLQEHIIAEPGTMPFYFEKIMRNMDLAMKANFNSRERDIVDWQLIFKEADQRFEFISCKPQSDGVLGILTWQWKNEKNNS